jgi:hypothetical protein
VATVDSKGAAPIPLAALFRDVFVLAGIHRGRLWMRIRIPLILILGSALLMASTGMLHRPALQVLFSVGTAFCMAAIAIGVHREALLLPVEGFASGEGFVPGLWRFLRYTAAAACYVAAYVLVARLVKYAANFLLAKGQLAIWPGWIQVLGSTVALITLSRFLLLMPALSIDTPRPVQSAWRLSRGNAWRVAFVFLAIPGIARTLVVWLYPQGVNSLQFVVLTVFITLTGIFHFAAMSFAFRYTQHPR